MSAVLQRYYPCFPDEENLWLRELDNRLNPQRLLRLTEEAWRLGKDAGIAAYIDAIMQANPKSMEEAAKMSESAVTLEEVLHRIGFIEKWEARGKAEGVAIGEAKGKAEIARNALSRGLSLEMIRDITGLDLETIKSLNVQ